MSDDFTLKFKIWPQNSWAFWYYRQTLPLTGTITLSIKRAVVCVSMLKKIKESFTSKMFFLEKKRENSTCSLSKKQQ